MVVMKGHNDDEVVDFAGSPATRATSPLH